MHHPLRFVLLRPRIAENVGAAARALKNFGWSDWAIVQPAFDDWEPARRMAVQAHDVLDQSRRLDDWSDATSDCVWVVGTSSRRRRGQRALSPREFAAVAMERLACGPVALIFGEETSGLTNDLLDRCHDVSTVRTDAAQPSMNLAQSILLYAYECRAAAQSAAGEVPDTLPRAATQAEIAALEATLKASLESGGFLHDGRVSALQELMTPLIRSRLTRHEAALWTAAVRTLSRSH